MVVGEASLLGDQDAGVGQGGEEFFRIGDTREGQNLASAECGERLAIGLQAAVEQGELAADSELDHPSSPVGRAYDEQRVRALKLRAKRRAQWAGRYYVAVADAAAAVDHDDREVLL